MQGALQEGVTSRIFSAIADRVAYLHFSRATLRTAVSSATRLETGEAPGGPEAVRMLLRIGSELR